MSIGTIPVSPTRRATLDDLAKVVGKAELINGTIVHYMATGDEPNRAAFVYASTEPTHCNSRSFSARAS